MADRFREDLDRSRRLLSESGTHACDDPYSVQLVAVAQVKALQAVACGLEMVAQAIDRTRGEAPSADE